MKRFIATAAIVTAHWQPAHSQTIVGSIDDPVHSCTEHAASARAWPVRSPNSLAR